MGGWLRSWLERKTDEPVVVVSRDDEELRKQREEELRRQKEEENRKKERKSYEDKGRRNKKMKKT